MVVRNIQWYGWKPDFPDPRDFRYKVVQPQRELKSVSLITEYDLYNTSPCYDQSTIGSCTGNGIGFTEELNFIKVGRRFMPARLFIYYNERLKEDSVQYDSGAQIRDGVSTLVEFGVCDEKFVPYNIADFRNKPSLLAYAEAIKHIAIEYRRIDNTNIVELVDCLSQGYPIVFGFTVFNSFESTQVAKDGIVGLPIPGEPVMGGHCCVIVGFDAEAQTFTIRNSWGTDWGIKGYFTMPVSYITNGQLASDFWMVTKVQLD